MLHSQAQQWRDEINTLVQDPTRKLLEALRFGRPCAAPSCPIQYRKGLLTGLGLSRFSRGHEARASRLSSS
jgi:hypothetical protein